MAGILAQYNNFWKAWLPPTSRQLKVKNTFFFLIEKKSDFRLKKEAKTNTKPPLETKNSPLILNDQECSDLFNSKISYESTTFGDIGGSESDFTTSMCQRSRWLFWFFLSTRKLNDCLQVLFKQFKIIDIGQILRKSEFNHFVKKFDSALMRKAVMDRK